MLSSLCPWNNGFWWWSFWQSWLPILIFPRQVKIILRIAPGLCAMHQVDANSAQWLFITMMIIIYAPIANFENVLKCVYQIWNHQRYFQTRAWNRSGRAGGQKVPCADQELDFLSADGILLKIFLVLTVYLQWKDWKLLDVNLLVSTPCNNRWWQKGVHVCWHLVYDWGVYAHLREGPLIL